VYHYVWELESFHSHILSNSHCLINCSVTSPGIFAYLNYGVSRTRIDVTRKLIDGLKRLEYRGYDSAGMVMDGTDGQVLIVREVGPVKSLQDLAEKQVAGMVCLYLFKNNHYLS
jgi:hypothetical protein